MSQARFALAFTALAACGCVGNVGDPCALAQQHLSSCAPGMTIEKCTPALAEWVLAASCEEIGAQTSRGANWTFDSFFSDFFSNPAKCGDGTCEQDWEFCNTCPEDCGKCKSKCGNGECEDRDYFTVRENASSCPVDCAMAPLLGRIIREDGTSLAGVDIEVEGHATHTNGFGGYEVSLVAQTYPSLRFDIEGVTYVYPEEFRIYRPQTMQNWRLDPDSAEMIPIY